MKQAEYSFEDLLRKVNRFVRNQMSKEEEAAFVRDVKANKEIGKVVVAICVFMRRNFLSFLAHY